MRKIFLLITVLIFLSASCRKSPVFRIEGKVPDEVFSGSNVYLVALDAPLTRRVDSTVVENGSFSFEIEADSFSVMILRIPARFPDIIEDLVVVAEDGTVLAVLDSISHGSGTRLNNILQEWKNGKRFHDSLQWDIVRQVSIAGSDNAKTDTLKALSGKISESMLSENIRLLNENLFNGIGLLIYKLYFDSLPVDEINYITQKTGKLYLEKDAQLKARFFE